MHAFFFYQLSSTSVLRTHDVNPPFATPINQRTLTYPLKLDVEGFGHVRFPVQKKHRIAINDCGVAMRCDHDVERCSHHRYNQKNLLHLLGPGYGDFARICRGIAPPGSV